MADTQLPARVRQDLANAVALQPVTITSMDEANSASALLRDVKDKIRRLTDARLEITRPMDESKRNVMALFQPALDQLAAVETATKRSLLAFQNQQRAAAESARVAAETEARNEALRLREQAQRHAVVGDEDTAQELTHAAARVETATIDVPTPQRVQGFVTRTTWHAEVVDLKLLCAAVATGRADISLVTPNMTALNMMARTAQAGLAVPGVRAVPSESGMSR